MLEEALKEEYDGEYETVMWMWMQTRSWWTPTMWRDPGGSHIPEWKEVLRFNGEMDYDDLCDILDRPLGKSLNLP